MQDVLNTLRMAQADSAFDHYEPIDGLFARIRNEGDDHADSHTGGTSDTITITGDVTVTPDPIDRLATLFEEQAERDEARDTASQKRIDDALEKLKGAEPATNKIVNEDALFDAWLDEYDQRGYSRGDFEMARMIMDGAGKMRALPIVIEPSETFMRAYHANVTEDVEIKRHEDGRITGGRIYHSDEKGRPVRAMDTAESGFGSQLIGVQYVRDLWAAARKKDTLVGDITTIPMTDPTVQVPIDGALPEMLFVGESTLSTASETGQYATSKTASNRVTLTAKKFTIQQIWSGELEEDSIIAFTPFLRERLNMSAALHLGSAYLNGDTETGGTGNVNLDNTAPGATKHYLAWNGIRRYWLVDNTGQEKNMAAALDLKEITAARGRLNGTDDDIDAAVGNINWGGTASDLRLIADWDTYMMLLDSDKVVTVDKYGPGATILTGELGRLYGIPIISPSYATKTEADGKAHGTESNNTLGQITLFNPQGWLGGVRRDVQLFFDRIQRTDQFLFELYTRRAFTNFGDNVAAGIRNITL